MSEKEERESMYKANCKACLIAEVMKTCNICRFNIGLQAKETVKPAEVKRES
jgi:hypothetical protein